MQSLFRISLFDEMELWLKGLVVHFRHAGGPLGTRLGPTRDADYLEEMRAGLQVAQDLLSLAQKLAELELRELLENEPRLVISPHLDSNKRPLALKAYNRRLGEFVSFWKFLDHSRIVAASLLRLPRIAQPEFRAFGTMFNEQARRFIRSGSFTYLKHKHKDSQFQSSIEREVLSQIRADGVQAQLRNIYLGFYDLLCVFKYIQQEMRRRFRFRKLYMILVYTYYANRSFLKVLDNAAKYFDYHQPALAEFTHSSRLALNMETKRIFETEVRDLKSTTRPEVLYSGMQNAVGLLENAFRESLVNTIRLLHPDFDEFTLFDDLIRRYEELVVLMDDLARLHKLTLEVEEGPTDDNWKRLIERVNQFRETSMKVLFFRDWPSFEQFSEEIAQTDPNDRSSVVNRFQVYVSTLLGEVQKRSVREKFESRSFSGHAPL